jgi:hypothetical protein
MACRYPAIAERSTITTTEPAIVVGSMGVRPNSRFVMRRLAATAPARPSRTVLDFVQLGRDVDDWRVRVGRSERVAHGSDPRERIAGGAHLEGHAARIRLLIWNIHRRRDRLSHVGVFRIPNDADDLGAVALLQIRTKAPARR